VAYVMSRFPKLTETFVLNELVALEALGARVALYPLLRERQAVRHPEAERWTRRARFLPFVSGPILRAQLHYLRHAPRTYLGLLREVLRRTWGSANFFLGALGIFPKSVRFAYEMERTGIAHVHAHFASHPAVAAFIVNRLTGIPFSFTAHGSDLHVERRMLDAKVQRAAFAVTVSEYNRRLMMEECGEAAGAKIHVIHCGVDLDAFNPQRLPRAAGPLRMLCVASFEEVKGHRHLLDACGLLRDQGLDFVCDLVGEGPLRRDVERRIAELELGDRVRVLGGRARPEVVRLFQEADLAVLPSQPTAQGKREGIPVVLMEAMASGLPVVSSALSGIPELVDAGVTGLLVPPANAAALADALATLARDPELRRRMGAAGRQKVVREFDLRANTAALLDLFLVAARSPAARREQNLHLSVESNGAGAALDCYSGLASARQEIAR
jgi:glycosyltransferase involved in cell wall biosynthesis